MPAVTDWQRSHGHSEAVLNHMHINSVAKWKKNNNLDRKKGTLITFNTFKTGGLQQVNAADLMRIFGRACLLIQR